MSEGSPQLPTPGRVKRDLAVRLGDQIREVRDRRKTREERWLRNHAAGVTAQSIGREQYRSDVFRHYIPVVRRSLERFTVRATRMLVPTPRFFEVFPGDDFDLAAGKRADCVRAYMEYLLLHRIMIRRLVSQLVRTFLLYEQAIVKTGVQLVNAPVVWGAYRGVLREVWPTAHAVDPFNFYVWPETVNDISEALLVFEDVMMPYQEYQQFAAQNICDPIRRDELSKPEWPRHHVERLAHLGLTEPDAVRMTADSGIAPVDRRERGETFVALSEAWFKAGGRWHQAWLVWNVAEAPRVTRLHPAPYPMPPYRLGIARPLPGELYTSSMLDDLEPLQALYNDQINQGEEARAVVAVPPVIIDPNLVNRADSIKFGPRQRWYGNIEGFSIPRIPDVSMSALRAQLQTLSMIQSMGATGPLTEGQPTRGMPRAGYAVNSLIGLATADIQDVAEIIEQEVLTPMLADLHRWTVAFVPPEQIIRIPGTQDYPPFRLSLSDLVGGWHFKWVGTLQAQDLQVRAQRLVAAMQTLVKIEPQLQLQGFTINWPALVRMVWRDGLGERGVEQIVVPIPPEMRLQMMLAAAGPAAQGGAPVGGPTGANAQAPASEADLMRSLSRVLTGQGEV